MPSRYRGWGQSIQHSWLPWLSVSCIAFGLSPELTGRKRTRANTSQGAGSTQGAGVSDALCNQLLEQGL